MNTLELEHRFEEIYGKRAEHTYFAPGRVNLIGEHTDYNGGLVFPCALSFGTYLLIAKREDRQNRFSSVNMDRSYTANANAFEDKPTAWIKYPIGVMKEFAERGSDGQKGAIEKTNKLIRQYIPKGTDFRLLTDEFIRNVQYKINRRPREKLNFYTPKECFFKLFA